MTEKNSLLGRIKSIARVGVLGLAGLMGAASGSGCRDSAYSKLSVTGEYDSVSWRYGPTNAPISWPTSAEPAEPAVKVESFEYGEVIPGMEKFAIKKVDSQKLEQK